MADEQPYGEHESGSTYEDDSALEEVQFDLKLPLLQRWWWQSRGVVYAISFSIPLLLLAALLGLGWATQSKSSPSDTPPVTVAIPTTVEFVPNTVPAMIHNTLPLAGMKQGYLFRGAVGQVWRISVEPDYDSTLDPLITLYAPSGAMLAQESRSIVITLPEKGDYRLLVESAQGGLTTGSYLLTLYED